MPAKGKKSYYCAYCGNWRRMTADHIVPKSQGGILTVFVCTYCNFTKGSQSLEEWLSKLPPEAPQHIYVPRFFTMSREEIVAFRKQQEFHF